MKKKLQTITNRSSSPHRQRETNQTNKQMTTTTKDKFHNANGTLTMYSFGCGYVERYGNQEFPRAVINREPNGWHVKGFDVEHVHFWEIFDTIKEARKFAKRITK